MLQYTDIHPQNRMNLSSEQKGPSIVTSDTGQFEAKDVVNQRKEQSRNENQLLLWPTKVLIARIS